MKTAVITGTSRGIGRATAQKFLDEGWSVVGTSTSGKSPLIHQNLRMFGLNLADPADITAFVAALKARTITPDVLINNAGVGLPADTETISVEVLRTTLEVNLIGLVALTEEVQPLMPDGGHIINLSSSMASLTQFMGTWSPAYKISKVAVNMYTRHLADVLKTRRILVSSFDPGWVRTDMGGSNAPRNPVEPATELFQLATSQVDTGLFWRGGKQRAW